MLAKDGENISVKINLEYTQEFTIILNNSRSEEGISTAHHKCETSSVLRAKLQVSCLVAGLGL